jgi:hypothetical protein
MVKKLPPLLGVLAACFWPIFAVKLSTWGCELRICFCLLRLGIHRWVWVCLRNQGSIM